MSKRRKTLLSVVETLVELESQEQTAAGKHNVFKILTSVCDYAFNYQEVSSSSSTLSPPPQPQRRSSRKRKRRQKSTSSDSDASASSSESSPPPATLDDIQEALMDRFEQQAYPTFEELDAMADEFGVHHEKIRRWFNKRRVVCSREHPFRILTDAQKDILERQFKANARMNNVRAGQIASELSHSGGNVFSRQVRDWFNNRQKDAASETSEGSTTVVNDDATPLGLLLQPLLQDNRPPIQLDPKIFFEVQPNTPPTRCPPTKTNDRIMLTDEQTTVLQKEFMVNERPNATHTLVLAAQLDIPVTNVREFFKRNRVLKRNIATDPTYKR